VAFGDLENFREHIARMYSLPLPYIRIYSRVVCFEVVVLFLFFFFDFFRPVKRPQSYQRKTDNLCDGLPSVIGDPSCLDLRLLPGHLSDDDVQSPVVAQIISTFVGHIDSDKRAGIRLRGPSGSGKTKAIFDVLSKVYGIYIDWSATQTLDIACFLGRVVDYRENIKSRALADQQAFERDCEKELCILYTARFLVLVYLIARGVVTCPIDWLYLQLNGLVLSHYHNLLGPVRNVLRAMSLSGIKELLAALTLPTNFPPCACGRAPGVIALDEVNELVKKLEKGFLSISSNLCLIERPLITLVLRATYNLAGPEVIVSGTSNVQDHFDYFLSLIGKMPQERPRVPMDLCTKYVVQPP